MRAFALLVLVLIGDPSSLFAADEQPATTSPAANVQRRIRAEDPRVRDALAAGLARSASFRELFNRVESRDVIVYIELDPLLRGRLAGRMRWVVSTRNARYVRVSVNPELTGFNLVSTLAHELQHVTEVGDAPSVVDEPSLSALYRGVGTERRAGSGAWDTEAAQSAGEVVRKELADFDVAGSHAANQDVQVSRLVVGHQR
jgi:hypothetical protein